jgi:hypothetical protein
MIENVIDMNRKSMKWLHFETLYNNQSQLNITLRAGAVETGAGAASRYGTDSNSSSPKMMWLRLGNIITEYK